MAFLDETGLAELWSLVKVEDAKALAADLMVVTGTFVGIGSGGNLVVTVGFRPKLVVLLRKTVTGANGYNAVLAFITDVVNATVKYDGADYNDTKYWLTDTGFAIEQTNNKYGFNAEGTESGYIAFG